MVTTHRSRPLDESHSGHGAMSGEPDELILPGWLNAARGRPSCNRVVRILKLVQQSEQSIRNILAQGAHFHVGPKKWPREHHRLWRADYLLSKELQQSLQGYTFKVRLTGTTHSGWLLNTYCLARKGDFGWETGYSWRPRPGQVLLSPPPTYLVTEGDAVLAALRLAERGLLGQVRLCAQCSLCWLFAAHKNYKFCGPICRTTYYANTPEYRESKRRQMREYRDRLRRLEAATNRV